MTLGKDPAIWFKSPSSERTKSEKEITRFYKKPSNRKRVEDDLIEKRIINYLEQFANIKDVKVETKKLRESENANKWENIESISSHCCRTNG